MYMEDENLKSRISMGIIKFTLWEFFTPVVTSGFPSSINKVHLLFRTFISILVNLNSGVI